MKKMLVLVTAATVTTAIGIPTLFSSVPGTSIPVLPTIPTEIAATEIGGTESTETTEIVETTEDVTEEAEVDLYPLYSYLVKMHNFLKDKDLFGASRHYYLNQAAYYQYLISQGLSGTVDFAVTVDGVFLTDDPEYVNEDVIMLGRFVIKGESGDPSDSESTPMTIHFIVADNLNSQTDLKNCVAGSLTSGFSTYLMGNFDTAGNGTNVSYQRFFGENNFSEIVLVSKAMGNIKNMTYVGRVTNEPATIDGVTRRVTYNPVYQSWLQIPSAEYFRLDLDDEGRLNVNLLGAEISAGDYVVTGDMIEVPVRKVNGDQKTSSSYLYWLSDGRSDEMFDFSDLTECFDFAEALRNRKSE